MPPFTNANAGGSDIILCGTITIFPSPKSISVLCYFVKVFPFVCARSLLLLICIFLDLFFTFFTFLNIIIVPHALLFFSPFLSHLFAHVLNEQFLCIYLS